MTVNPYRVAVHDKSDGHYRRRTLFTTGQVARLLLVASRTVSQWFDTGKLKGYRLPGSNDRRITRNALLDFLRANNLPIPAELEAVGLSVLCVGGVPLPGSESLAVRHAATAFDAGLMAQEYRPDVAVIDCAIGRGDSIRIGERLRTLNVATVVLANEDEEDEAALARTFAAVLRKPVEENAILDALAWLPNANAGATP